MALTIKDFRLFILTERQQTVFNNTNTHKNTLSRFVCHALQSLHLQFVIAVRRGVREHLRRSRYVSLALL